MHLCSRGVVRVDAYLSYLDVNQCAMPHHVPNAFKGSDRCDYQSTVVSGSLTAEGMMKYDIFSSASPSLVAAFVWVNTSAVADLVMNIHSSIRTTSSTVM